MEVGEYFFPELFKYYFAIYVIIMISSIPEPKSRQSNQNKSAKCIKMGLIYFFAWGGWSPNWVHSARRPLTGLLYLPRVIVRMENLVE
jgi:hypothetical protein